MKSFIVNLNLLKNPFKLFFLIAFLFALYATYLWCAYSFGVTNVFPKDLHAELYLGGFLNFSIIGFLLTSLPRFTKTEYPSLVDISFLFSMSVFMTISLFYKSAMFYWFSIFFCWLALIRYAVICFVFRKENPPYSFLFLALGLVFGSAGSFFLFFSSLLDYELDSFKLVGKVLFYDSMPFCMILGIGCRLIPGILGYNNIVRRQKQIYEKDLAFFHIIPNHFKYLTVIFLTSVFVESFGRVQVASILKTSVLTFISFYYFSIHKIPENRNVFKLSIIVSCWCLLISSWATIFFPDFSIHIKHISYINGYLLLTLLIGSRVVLAHSESSLSFENKAWPYGVFVALAILAGLTRASAFLIPNSYVNHLGYAAICLFGCLVLWLVIFIRKLI